MGYAFQNYCHETTEQLEEHIEAQGVWLGDGIISVTHDTDQNFIIDGVNADYTFISPDCYFTNNIYPPLLPIDIDFVGMTFGAMFAVIMIAAIGNRLINWW